MSDIKKMKLAELKKELSERGLSIKGNKAELVQRLQEFLDDGGDDDLNATDPEAEEEDVGEGEDDVEEDGGDDILEGDEEEFQEEVGKELDAEEDKLVLEETEEVKPELQDRNPITVVTPKVTKISTNLTDAEKKKLRAEKFNTPLPDDDRKAARAKRFGAVISSSSSTTQKSSGLATMSSDMERMKKRAERFGTNVAPVAVKLEEKEKLLKRKQRFGGLTASVGSPDLEAKKKMRAERFGVA